jgi:AcrR family transcriptional regulator
MELFKNEGMSGMSMRKVAKALDTGPSSLYVYFTNLQELSVYVLDYGLRQVVLHDPVKGRWKEDLYGALESYLMLLYELPGLAELSLTTIPMGDNSFRLTEYILNRLSEGGITSKSAAWGVDLFLYLCFLSCFRTVFLEEERDRTNNGYQRIVLCG